MASRPILVKAVAPVGVDGPTLQKHRMDDRWYTYAAR
jgi:hypothetical protein